MTSPLAGRSPGQRGRSWCGSLKLVRLTSVTLISAVLLVTGLTAAVPAAALPSAWSAGQHGAGAGTGICGKAASGRPGNCPAPLPAADLPAGARDKAVVAAPPAQQQLAQLVDTRTWTSGGGNTFPGADVPFGMTQWSPDTLPDRSDGGGYSYADTTLDGYSLTHVSGPGCPIAGDIPILPMTGALPAGNPNDVTTPFTHTGEVAQAGYYSAASNAPDTITSQFTATQHSAIGRFTFPQTISADFLIKLQDSQNADSADSAEVVGDNQVTGSDSSGEFCGRTNPGGQPDQYTVHFSIVFSQPFSASQVITQAGQADPAAVFLTFNTSTDPVIDAKIGVSYVSTANAQLNWQTEDPGWDFGAVQTAAQRSWDSLLGKIQVSGGSYAQTQEFYSLLYKDFLEPSTASDADGQYLGADSQVHTLSPGQHDQYGVYSGWDIYHSLSQLQAILDPSAASDMAQSLVNYYSQDGELQRWGYEYMDTFVMVGDPADSIIADYYAFGARHFDTRRALADMLTQANTVNNIRPGEALEQQYGYLPYDATYQCSECNKTEHDWVASLLENDNADLALSQFAAAQGDGQDAVALQRRANNWENLFDAGNGLLTPRAQDGQFLAGVTGADTAPYVEGSAEEYLWDVPNDYPALFSLLGGDSQVVPTLQQFLSQPNGGGMYAELSNEFGLGEQYALDYAGDPAGTQQAVSNIRNTMYLPGPSGLANNDDLGAESSQFIWEMLGLYPENPGSDNLLLTTPGFPHASVSLPGGNTITINAPGASATEFYADSLAINGHPDSKLSVPYPALTGGATLDWTLGTSPTSWGSAPQDAPASYPLGLRPAVGFVSSQQALVTPGGSTTLTVGAQDAADRAQTVTASVAAPAGITVTPGSASIQVPADGQGNLAVTVSAAAGEAEGLYPVTVGFTEAGQVIGQSSLTVAVDAPGDLAPFFDNTGITDDSAPTQGNFDGSGNSYSAQALAADGITPGGTVASDGVTFTWPDTASGTADNVIADGQTIALSGSGPTLGFLGTGVNASYSATGTVYYTDGSSQQFTISFVNWTSGSPPAGDTVVATTPYLNTPTGQLARTRYLYGAFVPLDPSRTVEAVQLPAAGSGDTGIHIFAVAIG
jgi:predicted alpha-1,2-mannosidase